MRAQGEFPRKYIRHISIAVCLAAVLVTACCLFTSGASGASISGDILITEIVSSNCVSLAGPNGSSPDWIELYNRSDSNVSLSGYSIGTSFDGERHTLGDITVPANGYTTVYAETGSGAASTGFSLSSDGEKLYLFSPDGEVLEYISVPSLFTDVSYARRGSGSFGYCLHPTPAAANETQIENMRYYETRTQSADLVVTEVMPHPSSGSAWIELYNAGRSELSLDMFFVAGNEQNVSPVQLPKSILEAGQYALVYASGAQNVLSAPLNFGSEDRGAYLFDVTGTLRSSLAWAIYPGCDIAVVAADTYTKTPTPGAANSEDIFTLKGRAAMDSTDPVHINEVLVSNMYSIADPEHERCAWIEVHNTSAQPVSLSGYYVSDDANDPLKWPFPDITLEPDGYSVALLCGKTGTPGELRAPFRIAEDESTLYLTELNSMRTDTFVLPAEQADGVSVGRTENGESCYYACPSPGSANAESFPTISAALESRTKGVYISEVCAASADEDWVELYNSSDKSMDLSGWYLSDDAGNLKKWRISSLTVGANGYKVIELDGDSDDDAVDDDADDDDVPFAISITGETLTLTNASGAVIDFMETGNLRVGVTSGRAQGDAALTRVFFEEPTPGAQNSSRTCMGYASAPLLSETGLYHTEAFTLTISAPVPDADIYYTLDGSKPDKTDKRYTAPITISRNTVVRAVAFEAGLLPSEATTETYLFEEPHTVPVFCLSGEPSEIDIIFHQANRNYKPMYGGNVEYYETDGTLGVSFTAGIKPKGRSSLDLGQNSVTLKMREQYGRNEITYPFFETGDVTSFREITLRNSGEDRIRSRLRDSFVHKLAEGLNVATIRTRIVAVYVNGVYWGFYDLTEEQEEGYFESYFGLKNEDMDMIDRNKTVMEGSADDYLTVREYARTWNLADDAVFAEFAKHVDTDACMDYLVINTFFGNGDVINQRFWRAKDNSVRWQPLLFDLDWCLRFNDYTRQTFTRYFSKEGATAVNATVTNMDIFYGLKQNKAWREAFIDRFIELAYTNFDTDRMLALFDATVEQMNPEMLRQIAKWHTHEDMDAWLEQTQGMREALIKRRDIVMAQLAEAFGLSDAQLQARIEAFTSAH